MCGCSLNGRGGCTDSDDSGDEGDELDDDVGEHGDKGYDDGGRDGGWWWPVSIWPKMMGFPAAWYRLCNQVNHAGTPAKWGVKPNHAVPSISIHEPIKKTPIDLAQNPFSRVPPNIFGVPLRVHAVVFVGDKQAKQQNICVCCCLRVPFFCVNCFKRETKKN